MRRALHSRALSLPFWRTTKRLTDRCECRRRWSRISAPTACCRVGSEGLQRLAPKMVVALVALLAGLSLGTGVLIFRHFKADASATSRLYSGVFGGLNNPRPGAEAEALLRLGEQVRGLGLPLVVTDTAGRVTAAANLPFEAPLDDPRVKLYAARLDRQNPPISDAAVGTVHYGPLPAQRNLIGLAVLQGLTIAVMVAVAGFSYPSAM